MTEKANQIISPEETEAEKLRLIKLLRNELKIHGLVDATGYIDENTIINKSHTHSGFVRSVAYKMEKMGIVEVIAVEDWKRYYIKELSWEKRHPFLHAMRINFANSFLYIIAGVLIALIGSRVTKTKLEERLDTQKNTIQNLYDSVTNLRQDLKGVQDSLKKSSIESKHSTKE